MTSRCTSPAAVHGGQRIEELVEQAVHAHARRKGAVVAEQGGDGAATDQRHHEEDTVVLAGPRERGHDVRMLHAVRLLAQKSQKRRSIGLAEHLGRDVPVASRWSQARHTEPIPPVPSRSTSA